MHKCTRFKVHPANLPSEAEKEKFHESEERRKGEKNKECKEDSSFYTPANTKNYMFRKMSSSQNRRAISKSDIASSKVQ